MEEKINVAEILKDKPQRTKLYSPICGECKLSYIESEKLEPQISTESDAFGVFYFWDDGKAYNEGECLLFPSDKMRDWAKFAWKKGDVLKNTAYEERVIFDGFLNEDYTYFKGKHPLDCSDKFNITYHEECNCFTGNYRLESTDAAQTYINTIEERLGGKLNRDTLEIEKAQPKFKDWDFITIKLPRGRSLICVFKEENDENYYLHADLDSRGIITINENSYCSKDGCITRLSTEEEKAAFFDALAKKGKIWDVEKKKIMDLKPKVKLKPFDRVLCRDGVGKEWHIDLFESVLTDNSEYNYKCMVNVWKICIPYKGNEHLLGTTKDVEG